MIGPDHPVFGRHRRPFHDRQDIPLHPFPGNGGAGATGSLSTGHLVNLVDEDHPRILYPAQSLLFYLLHIDETLRLFLFEYPSSLGNGGTAVLLPLGKEVAQHILDVELFHAGAGKDLYHRGPGRLTLFDIDHPAVEFACPQFLPELLPGLPLLLLFLHAPRHLDLSVRGGTGTLQGRKKEIKDSFLRIPEGLLPHRLGHLRADHIDSDLRQVPDHRFNITPHIADLGIFRGLHFDEGRFRQRRQAARNLRLSHAGGTDHNNVLGEDLLPQLLGELKTAPPVPNGNRHGPFRFRLTDNVFIQFGNDLPGGKF